MRIVLLFFLFVSGAMAATPSLPIKGESILTKKEVLVGQQKSKALVLVFLSAKCPCSDSHIAELAALSSEFSDFEFVGVHSNMDEDADLSKKYFEAKQLPFDVIQDNKTKMADDFKAFKTPHAFIIKPSGEILYQGGVTNSANFARSDKKFLRAALEDIAAKREVQTPEGRTLGCVIARSK